MFFDRLAGRLPDGRVQLMVQNLGAEVAPDAVIDVNLDALGLTLQLPW